VADHFVGLKPMSFQDTGQLGGVDESLIYWDLHGSGLRAENLEEAGVRVAANELPEQVVDAQGLNNARRIRFVHLLLQHRWFSIVQGTVQPGR